MPAWVDGTRPGGQTLECCPRTPPTGEMERGHTPSSNIRAPAPPSPRSGKHTSGRGKLAEAGARRPHASCTGSLCLPARLPGRIQDLRGCTGAPPRPTMPASQTVRDPVAGPKPPASVASSKSSWPWGGILAPAPCLLRSSAAFSGSWTPWPWVGGAFTVKLWIEGKRCFVPSDV